MECPRCGRPLERYVLRGREAVACDSCGYIGVPVEHSGEIREFESWDEAISRVGKVDSRQAVTVETRDEPTPVFEGDDADGEPSPTVVRIETPDGDGDDVAGSSDVTDNGDASAFACDVCGKHFAERRQLQGHMASHSTEK